MEKGNIQQKKNPLRNSPVTLDVQEELLWLAKPRWCKTVQLWEGARWITRWVGNGSWDNKQPRREHKCWEWVSISNHRWGCATQSCLIRAGVPGTASSLLQQRLQVSTARPATKDARTTHIRGLSAISLGLQSRSFPLVHLNTGLEWCNPPPSATRHFSPSHTLFSPFTCNTCNDLFLEFNACQRIEIRLPGFNLPRFTHLSPSNVQVYTLQWCSTALTCYSLAILSASSPRTLMQVTFALLMTQHNHLAKPVLFNLY